MIMFCKSLQIRQFWLNSKFFCYQGLISTFNQCQFSTTHKINVRSTQGFQPSKKLPTDPKIVYQNLENWKNNEDLINELIDSIVYYDPEQNDGVIAINKPYGLSRELQKGNKFSFKSVLPGLQEALNLSELNLVYFPERYSSGICLLSTKSKVHERIKKNMTSNFDLLKANYFVLTDDYPIQDKAFEKVDVLLKRVPHKKSIKGGVSTEPVISRALKSRTALRNKSDFVQRNLVYMNVLHKSGKGPASLVSIQSWHIHRHFLNIYMADMLSPIIGDHMYSYRARRLMGKMVTMGTQHSPHNNSQIFSDWLRSKLNIKKGEELIVPKHTHLFRLHIPKFYSNNKDLTIYAPPPQYFKVTAKALGVEYNLEKIMDEDVVHYGKDLAKQFRISRKEDEAKVRITHQSDMVFAGDPKIPDIVIDDQ